MERIGIYGGTFNPPHLGHVRAAYHGAAALELTKLLVIPSCVAPHKQMPQNSATGEQRLEMLTLCFGGNPGVEVSDLELSRGGASFTWETVAQVRQQYPEAELILFMGTDMFLSFLQWKNPEKILQDASLAVFYRGEAGEAEAIARQKEILEAAGSKVYLVENPVTAISSTDLRRMLVFRCADPFLPEGIGEYIRSHGLYDAAADLRGLPMEELEKVVVSLLKPNRVAHVLGCRDTAADLARVWGANETDAARAGVLHDITKALDGPLQLTLCQEYGIILDNFSSQNPKTLHALTGSLVAERIFGESEAVVSAICSHTTGKSNMNLLEKIIYVADYMEPNRDFPGVEELRELAYTDINKALKRGLEMTLEMLRSQKREISPESQQALKYLQESGV